MTEKYRRNQSLVKGLAIDTPQMRAAINLTIAVKDGLNPDKESLNILADAFMEVFGGVNPKVFFGNHLGLVPTLGRQSSYGFTPAHIVSAVIEIERRKLGNVRGALSKAKQIAIEKFIDINGESAMRSVERDWAEGKATVSELSDDNLIELVRPYKY